MKKIDSIVIHCSATKAGLDIGKKEITQMHLQRGFSTIGYNFVVRLDGTVEVGRSLQIDGAHCNSKGFSGVSYNKHSIGICYVGGTDENGKPADTRTPAQKKALEKLIRKLCSEYRIVEVLGHRDTSPDLDNDGIVEPNEWTKMCPCFDVRSEYPFIPEIVVKP
jgi:hypothetical protein